MVEFVVIEEPVKCPICEESGRLGFLKRIFQTDIVDMGLPNGGSQKPSHVCNTCGAVYGAK